MLVTLVGARTPSDGFRIATIWPIATPVTAFRVTLLWPAAAEPLAVCDTATAGMFGRACWIAACGKPLLPKLHKLIAVNAAPLASWGVMPGALPARPGAPSCDEAATAQSVTAKELTPLRLFQTRRAEVKSSSISTA